MTTMDISFRSSQNLCKIDQLFSLKWSRDTTTRVLVLATSKPSLSALNWTKRQGVTSNCLNISVLNSRIFLYSINEYLNIQHCVGPSHKGKPVIVQIFLLILIFQCGLLSMCLIDENRLVLVH